jgi:hypothetical protein
LSTNTGSGESVQFAYKHNHERWRAVYTGSAGVETTYFVGDLLEKVSQAGSTDYRHYIYASGIKVAIYSRTTGGVNTLHYVREDHLGSVAAILNSDGTTYVKESFAAFGARRSACSWSGPPTNGTLTKIDPLPHLIPDAGGSGTEGSMLARMRLGSSMTGTQATASARV